MRQFIPAILACLAIGLCDARADLSVGDPAPPLNVDQWVQGSKVSTFEEGKIYVVEFWATWCGPCVAGIPHLTDVQKKYAKYGVTVIGVSTQDTHGNNLGNVQSLVKQKGKEMDYTVAFCNTDTTWKNWMTAAGRNSIPSAFLVGRDGKIAWIGHPSGVVAPIRQILSSDHRAHPEPRPARPAADRPAPLEDSMTDRQHELAQTLIERIDDDLADGDTTAAAGAMERLVRLEPTKFNGYAVRCQTMLIDINERVAFAKARELLMKTYARQPAEAAWVAAAIVRAPHTSKELVEFIQPHAERLASQRGEDPRFDVLRAELAIEAGEIDEAMSLLSNVPAALTRVRMHLEVAVQLDREALARLNELKAIKEAASADDGSR